MKYKLQFRPVKIFLTTQISFFGRYSKFVLDQVLTFSTRVSSEPRSEENNKPIQTLTSNRPLLSGNQSTFRTLHFKSMFSNWEQLYIMSWWSERMRCTFITHPSASLSLSFSFSIASSVFRSAIFCNVFERSLILGNAVQCKIQSN